MTKLYAKLLRKCALFWPRNRANDCSRRRVKPIAIYIMDFMHLNVKVVTLMYLFLDDNLCKETISVFGIGFILEPIID